MGMGAGIELSKGLGKLWGREQLYNWGLLEVYPPKTPIFGDRDRLVRRLEDT